MSTTFAAKFCRHHGVRPEDFGGAVLRHTLYLPARWAGPLLRLFDRQHFAADLEFIQTLANLTKRSQFLAEARAFNYHPANLGFLRRKLRLRVSVRRLRALFEEVMAPESDAAKTDPAAPPTDKS